MCERLKDGAMRRWRIEFLAQIFGNQFHERTTRASEEERIFRAAAFFGNDDEILGKELRFAGNG